MPEVLDFQYKITVATTTGDLCSDLKVARADDGLNEFISSGVINSGENRNFDFNIYLKDDATVGLHKEKTCTFKFLISAWQNEPEGIDENTGFNDLEEISVMISLMGHYKEWLEKLGLSTENNIVINEFLPMADKVPEFIELYNKGNSTTTISNWKICYTDDITIKPWLWCKKSIPINTATIFPNGFYVIYPTTTDWIGMIIKVLYLFGVLTVYLGTK